ncbi:MAG: alpha-amylase family glycosyl hydrolase, partial [Bdellovibrionales bacterium]
DWDRLEMARSPEDVLAVQEVMSKKRLFGLPGFNHTHPEVEKYLINAYKKFIDLGVTGFRVDAVMYVQRGFTAKFINELNSYALNKGKRLTFVLEILARNNNSINPIIEDLLLKIEMKDRIFFLDFPLMYELRRIHFQADYDLRWLVGFMKYRSEIKMQTERMVPTIINHDFGTVLNDANDEKAIYALAEVFSFQPSVMFHGSEQTGRIKNNREQIHDIQEQGDIAILENIFYETLKPYRADRYVFTNTIIHEESRDCLLLEKKLDKRSVFLFVSKGDVGSSHFAKFLTQQKQSKILIRYINGEPIIHRNEGSEVVTLTSKGKSVLLFEVISK